MHVVTNVEQQVQARRAQGASDDEIYRLRTAAFDAQAASRLAEVDREGPHGRHALPITTRRDRLMQSQTKPRLRIANRRCCNCNKRFSVQLSGPPGGLR